MNRVLIDKNWKVIKLHVKCGIRPCTSIRVKDWRLEWIVPYFYKLCRYITPISTVSTVLLSQFFERTILFPLNVWTEAAALKLLFKYLFQMRREISPPLPILLWHKWVSWEKIKHLLTFQAPYPPARLTLESVTWILPLLLKPRTRNPRFSLAFRFTVRKVSL